MSSPYFAIKSECFLTNNFDGIESFTTISFLEVYKMTKVQSLIIIIDLIVLSKKVFIYVSIIKKKKYSQ